MNNTEKEMELNKNDEMNFVIKNYGEIIKNTLGTSEIAVSFFANSETFVDKIEPIKKPNLDYEGMKVLIYQDYSLDRELLADCNICFIGDKKFLKIITPFTREGLMTSSSPSIRSLSLSSRNSGSGKKKQISLPSIFQSLELISSLSREKRLTFF